ncbi:GrpB family protein [Actinomycetospora soli]|uniref:GrpB family protein n=1 Tax=Actinomycetospora soli TaxID=2893887 RepID=UPI001E2AFB65|nr:GrpB family protein [Actinomycetospora soli]MCD2185795.1 GrpB family protein [Actinomycetospora soli]
MSEESLDVDLQRASAAWPRPVRVGLVPPDPGWPDEAARWAERLARPVRHVGATAVPGLPAHPQIDLLVLDPDDEAARSTLEAWDMVEVGSGTWRRPALPDDGSCPTAVEVRLLRPHDPAVEPVLRFRDLLRADEAAARRYTDVRRGLAGEYGDLGAYRRAKGPVIAALLRG